MVGVGWLFGIKILSALATPLSIALAAIAFGWVRQLRSRSRGVDVRSNRLVAGALGSLVIVAMPVVSKWTASTLEDQYPPTAIAEMAVADVAVLLGGATRGVVAPRLEIELGTAGNRIIHAARIYRAGRVRKILIAAGALSWDGSSPAEADAIGKVLVELGVPVANLIFERRSRTTLENAQQTKDIWQEHSFRSGYLVTSALHMPRASALFRSVGLDLVPASTDVAATLPLWSGPLDFLPNAQALVLFSSALHEWIGILVDRLRGITSRSYLFANARATR